MEAGRKSEDRMGDHLTGDVAYVPGIDIQRSTLQNDVVQVL